MHRQNSPKLQPFTYWSTSLGLIQNLFILRLTMGLINFQAMASKKSHVREEPWQPRQVRAVHRGGVGTDHWKQHVNSKIPVFMNQSALANLYTSRPAVEILAFRMTMTLPLWKGKTVQSLLPVQDTRNVLKRLRKQSIRTAGGLVH